MKQDTKQLIFHAALELFAKYGYMDVSVRDIAKKVAIKAASIYYHYPSKEDILDDILNYYDKRISYYIQELDKVDLSEVPVDEYPLKMHFVYKPDEILLMFWAGQVVLNEQFNNRKAAELIIGAKFDEYTDSYERFLKNVALKLSLNHNNYRIYAEMLTRVSISYMMQFQHLDMFDPIKISNDMDDMYRFVFSMFLKG